MECDRPGQAQFTRSIPLTRETPEMGPSRIHTVHPRAGSVEDIPNIVPPGGIPSRTDGRREYRVARWTERADVINYRLIVCFGLPAGNSCCHDEAPEDSAEREADPAIYEDCAEGVGTGVRCAPVTHRNCLQLPDRCRIGLRPCNSNRPTTRSTVSRCVACTNTRTSGEPPTTLRCDQDCNREGGSSERPGTQHGMASVESGRAPSGGIPPRCTIRYMMVLPDVK